MRKQVFGLMLTGFILIAFAVFAQNENYPTKVIKGTKYFVYAVQPHEGLYAISRRFGVTQADINTANPQLEDVLKVGQEILIPVTDANIQFQNKKTESKTDKTEFIEHKVEKKQTLFAISRKYNVSQDEIKKYNPEIENGLQEGVVLRIPVLKESQKQEFAHSQTDTNQKSESNNQYNIHVVQEKETLYSISRKYNVDIMDVVKLNPGSSDHITLGSELKIPVTKNAKKEKADNSETKPSENKEVKTENHISEEVAPALKLTGKINPVRIAFLLPFMLDQGKSDAGTERFVDFYRGALIAMQEAQRKGISVEVFTYDTERSVDKMSEILNKPELKTMNLIIGPAFSNQVAQISTFALENKVNTLIPFTSKVTDILTNPYLFQFNPGNEAKIKLQLELISGKLRNYHVVFADIQDISPLDEGNIWSGKLESELKRLHKSYSHIDLFSADNVNLTSVLKRGVKNLIVFNTDKYTNVSPYITAFKRFEKEFNPVLFEQYAWLNQTVKLNDNVYLSPFNQNINQTDLTIFEAQYDISFNRTPSTDIPRFDLLGFDLTNYFIGLINHHGTNFAEKASNYNSFKWIQSQSAFERFATSTGFINQKLYIGEEKAE